MNARNAVAPEIAGFAYRDHLGSGGFADVFLYDQRRPARQVAVKVLLAERLDAQARERFDVEADLMALLSNHANIVTMYQADITADGRPFLVMEYCPRPNLGVRYKREPLSVVEALSTGVQIAGAVETVHRAGILHRDIKPANVLVTEYNRPVLTDFGISVATGQAERAEGLSIPWSPPEAIANPTNTGVAADVYSLAATIYTLLAGRHPFEVPGGDNRQHAIISRIESAPVPGLARADVPAALEQVLAAGMAKDPASRYSSALALGRALQQVQVELQLPMTALDVREDAENTGMLPDDDDEPGTRIRSVTAIDPSPQLPSAWTDTDNPTQGRAGLIAPPAAWGGAKGGGAPHAPAAGVIDSVPTGQGQPRAWAATPSSFSDEVPADTVHRAAVPAPDQPTAQAEASPRSRGRTVAFAVSAGVLVAAGVGVVLALQGSGEPEAPMPTATSAAPVDAMGSVVSPVTDLRGASNEFDVTFTWGNPEGMDGDVFLWRLTRGSATNQEQSYQTLTDPMVAIGRDQIDPAAGEVCIDVLVRRTDGQGSEPTEGCVQP